MVLLLRRRDLPRKLAKIEGNTLSFKICNKIEFSFNLDDNKISFKLEGRSGAVSSCNMDREDPYVNYFLDVKTFEREEIDLMLSN